MAKITVEVTPVCVNPPKAKLPRKLKKDIVKVAGRDSYKEIIAKMQDCYNHIGYVKFKFKRQ